MKSFIEFVAEEAKYDREKHSKKLDKTATSLNNHLKRTNYRHDNKRTWELVDRYEDLSKHMKTHDWEGWKKHCEKRGLDRHHNGHDLLA